MEECSSAVVFSVTVLLKKGDSSRNNVRNSIRKTSTKNSWYDLFEEVTQQIDESPDTFCWSAVKLIILGWEGGNGF